MGVNLTDLYIDETFQKLIQIDGDAIADGTGSAITNLNVSASYATKADTANSSQTAVNAIYAQEAVSSSYALTASIALNATDPDWENITDKPNGLVSSSVQIVLANTTGDLDGTRITGTVANATNSISASYSVTAVSSSFANTSISSSHSTTADTSISSSYATTASYALNSTPAFPYTGSAGILGDLAVDGNITGSRLRVENNTHLDGTLRVTNDTTINGDVRIQSATPMLLLRDTSGGGFSSGYDLRVNTGSFEIYDDTHNRDVLSDFFNTGTSKHTTSLTSEIIVISGSDSVTIQGQLTASLQEGHGWFGNADGVATPQSTSSFAKTDKNNVFTGTQSFDTITATSASFSYVQTVTGSAVIIGEQYIILNADSPTQRFAGIQVYDSGSFTTGSFEWDSVDDNWIQVKTNGQSGGIITGVHGTKGAEVYPSNNTLIKGTGTESIQDSIITDDGSTVTVGGDLTANVIQANTYFVGDVIGNASTATTASYAIISETAVSASHSLQSDNAIASQTAVTASYALTSANDGQWNGQYTGAASITGSLTVTDLLQADYLATANYADDTAAQAAGIPINGIYRSGNVLMVRLT